MTPRALREWRRDPDLHWGREAFQASALLPELSRRRRSPTKSQGSLLPKRGNPGFPSCPSLSLGIPQRGIPKPKAEGASRHQARLFSPSCTEDSSRLRTVYSGCDQVDPPRGKRGFPLLAVVPKGSILQVICRGELPGLPPPVHRSEVLDSLQPSASPSSISRPTSLFLQRDGGEKEKRPVRFEGGEAL